MINCAVNGFAIALNGIAVGVNVMGLDGPHPTMRGIMIAINSASIVMLVAINVYIRSLADVSSPKESGNG